MVVVTGGVVGEIEVEHELAVLRRAEVGALDRVEQVPAAAVGRRPRRRVTERDEHAATVDVDPEDLEPADRQVHDAEAAHRHRLAAARLDLDALPRPGIHAGGEAHRGVVVEVPQAAERCPARGIEGRLRVRPEHAVAHRPPTPVPGLRTLFPHLGVHGEDPATPAEEVQLVCHRR